jgi:uncharacterized damage-inducible protein DinB
MYRSVEDFKNEWSYEMEATIKVFRYLTDASLNQKVVSDGRSLGRLAWHITCTIPEMLNRVGLSMTEIPDDGLSPDSANNILQTYERVAAAVLDQISGWSDSDLSKEDGMYGEMWKRGFTLSVLIKHQTHHRAQMTVLMRQAGLSVPGVYGPSKEEWAQMNMPPMK